MKPKNARHNLKSQRRGKKSKTPTHEAKNKSSIQIKGKQCLPRGFLISFNHEELKTYFLPVKSQHCNFQTSLGWFRRLSARAAGVR